MQVFEFICFLTLDKLNTLPILELYIWMGGRVVEGTGLENRRACKRTVGSNPTPSAKYNPVKFSAI